MSGTVNGSGSALGRPRHSPEPRRRLQWRRRGGQRHRTRGSECDRSPSVRARTGWWSDGSRSANCPTAQPVSARSTLLANSQEDLSRYRRPGSWSCRLRHRTGRRVPLAGRPEPRRRGWCGAAGVLTRRPHGPRSGERGPGRDAKTGRRRPRRGPPVHPATGAAEGGPLGGSRPLGRVQWARRTGCAPGRRVPAGRDGIRPRSYGGCEVRPGPVL